MGDAFKKKLKILDILPTDPNRVNVDRIIELSRVITALQKKKFAFLEIAPVFPKKYRRYYITTSNYFVKVGLFNKEKGRRIYSINEKNPEVTRYFNNIKQHNEGDALSYFLNIYKQHLLPEILNLFNERKIRTKEELINHFKNIEIDASDTTVDRKVTFLASLLDRMGLLYYNQQKQELIWRNGNTIQIAPIEPVPEAVLFAEGKITPQKGNGFIKEIKPFGEDSIIITFQSNPKKRGISEILDKIKEEL